MHSGSQICCVLPFSYELLKSTYMTEIPYLIFVTFIEEHIYKFFIGKLKMYALNISKLTYEFVLTLVKNDTLNSW
jgi:hypothetical protein